MSFYFLLIQSGHVKENPERANSIEKVSSGTFHEGVKRLKRLVFGVHAIHFIQFVGSDFKKQYGKHFTLTKF